MLVPFVGFKSVTIRVTATTGVIWWVGKNQVKAFTSLSQGCQHGRVVITDESMMSRTSAEAFSDAIPIQHSLGVAGGAMIYLMWVQRCVHITVVSGSTDQPDSHAVSRRTLLKHGRSECHSTRLIDSGSG